MQEQETIQSRGQYLWSASGAANHLAGRKVSQLNTAELSDLWRLSLAGYLFVAHGLVVKVRS